MCHERLQKEYVQSHYSKDGKLKEGIKFPEIPYRKQKPSYSPKIESNHKIINNSNNSGWYNKGNTGWTKEFMHSTNSPFSSGSNSTNSPSSSGWNKTDRIKESIQHSIEDINENKKKTEVIENSSSVKEDNLSSKKRNNTVTIDNTVNRQEEDLSFSSKKSRTGDNTSSPPPVKTITVQKGNDKKNFSKVSDMIPLKKQYNVLDKSHIYDELSDEMNECSIFKSLTTYRIDNAIAYTIAGMKKDSYLYKKICPSATMKRIKKMYAYTADYEYDEFSESTLFQIESRKEDISLSELKEEN